MRVGFKRVLIGLIVLVALALGALAVFLLTFDPNAYKGKFQEVVYERYGRTLTIDGDIELSLFPRIGLAVQNVALSNPGAADDLFASIDSARFAVAIWPLLFNRFVVDHVSISGFKAWIRRDEQGQYNFNDLFAGAGSLADPIALAPRSASLNDSDPAISVIKEAAAESISATDADASRRREETAVQIDIAGLELRDGQIHYLDVKREKAARLVNLQLNTGRITFYQPFDVSLRGHLQGEDPQADATVDLQAQVKFDALLESYSAQRLNLLVSGLVGPVDAKSASLRGNFAYNGYSRMLDASAVEMQLQGTVLGERPINNLNASLNTPRLKVDQTHSELNVERMSIRATGALPEDEAFDLALDAPRLSISPETAEGEAIAGTVKLEGRRTLGLTLGMKGLGGNAWNLSLKELKIDGRLQEGKRLMLVNMSTPVRWDVINEKGAFSAIKGDVTIQGTEEPISSFEFPLIGSLHADLAKDEITSDINAVLNGAPLNFNLKATQLSDPKLRFALQADMLDFDRLLPTTAAAKPVQVPDTERVDTGKPAPQETPEAKAEPAPKEPKPAPRPINLSFLNDIDVAGTVKLGGMIWRGVQAGEVTMSVAAADGQFNLDNIAAELYEGSLNGTLNANAQNQFAAKAEFKQVSMGPLMRAYSGTDSLTGRASGNLDLKSAGSNPSELMSALVGAAQLHVKDGAIRGIDLNQTLVRVGGVLTSVLDGKEPDVKMGFDLGNRTAFDSLDGAVAIENGVVDIRKLDFRTPLLRVTQGKPALIDLIQQRFDLLANVRVLKVGGGENQVDLSVLRGLTVPVLVTGALDTPQFRVVWDQMGGTVIKNAIQRGLLDMIEKQGPQPPGIPITPQTPTPSPEEAVKNLGKTLKGLLGGN